MRKQIICLALAVLMLGAMPVLALDEPEMHASPAIINFIKHYERFSSTPYEDMGELRIGYGSLYDSERFPEGIISEYEASLLLSEDVEFFSAAVRRMMRKQSVELSQHQFDALVSLSYNLGSGWMSSEYRLYNMLCGGIERYTDLYIVNTFSRYSNVNGELWEPLIYRRLAEAMIFIYGDYGFGGTPVFEYEYEEKDNDSFTLFKQSPGITTPLLSDVKYTDWFYQYVSPLCYLSVVDGNERGLFCPMDNTTFGEAAKLVLLAAGYPEQQPLSSSAHWASGYIYLAEQLGFLDDEASLSPGEPISRLSVAKLTALALALEPVQEGPFADTQDVYINALAAVGVVEGSYDEEGATVYRPDSFLTRAELCAILWRLMNLR